MNQPRPFRYGVYVAVAAGVVTATSVRFDVRAHLFAIVVVAVATGVAAGSIAAAAERFSARIGDLGVRGETRWRDRLWLVVIVGVVVGAWVWLGERDLRAHPWAIAVGAVATGVAAAALLVGGDHYSGWLAAIRPRAIVATFLVLVAIAVPLAVVLDSGYPGLVVCGYGIFVLLCLIPLWLFRR